MHEVRLFAELTPQQQVHKDKLMQVLKDYMPQPAVSLSAELIMYYRMHLHIEVERKGRYGDYTPHSGKGYKISINHNLSPFEFLITFIHEMAHHTACQKYGNNHDAHGKEWKQEFKYLMKPFLEMDIFPYDLKAVLSKHMQNPKYSQAADVKLLQVLRRYDEKKKDALTLAQLPDGAIFHLKSDKTSLRKIRKMRTYVLCESLDQKWQYRIHAMVEVVEINNPI